MATLVIAEHNNEILAKGLPYAIAAAQQLDNDISVCVVGHGCDAVAEQAALFSGVTQVLCIDHPVYTDLLAENMAKAIANLAEGLDYVIAASSVFTKNLLPRLAGLLSVAPLSDVIRIVDAQTFVRPIYAGNALATVESLDRTKIMTIRQTAFSPVGMAATPAPIQKVNAVHEHPQTQFISHAITQQSRPELTAARVIVSGGRALQSAENFKMLETLADTLGAAIGASRAAVDAGMVPNEYQVGQTGKVVAPELYFAIGISGAIQHVAGMKDSKVIVAINKDPDAPIFKIADYGLVGDLFQIVPELTAKIATALGK